MLRELRERIFSSRILVVGAVYVAMLVILISRLFRLQLVDGEKYLNDYVMLTEKTVTEPATRGNIYDRNGKLLAYNELAYAVTVQDNGEYKKATDRNYMLYQLVKILEAHKEPVLGELQIGLDQDGNYYFTTPSEPARLRFLRDFYGKKSVDDLNDSSGKTPTDVTAADLIDKKSKEYKLDELGNPEGEKIELTAKERLDIINIKYTMNFTSFKKYEATKVASGISDETRADILENASQLLGVNIEEETLRHYNDAKYIASVIGYTGKIQPEQLDELKATIPDIDENDMVGRSGIEAYMESKLHGKKGEKTIYVDKVGHIMKETNSTPSQPGNDVYLTIDRDLQVGIYHQLEQQLAGILTKKLSALDSPNGEGVDSTDRMIPIKDAYFQLINNNVLSVDKFHAQDATENEKGIYAKYVGYKDSAIAQIRAELETSQARPLKELSEDQKAYMYYLYNKLSSDQNGIIKKSLIDTNADYYVRWKNDDISMREFLYDGIASSWIDTTKLNIDSKYSDADDIYTALVNFALDGLSDDNGFEKTTYKYLIKNNIVSGRELCLALYDQGILARDDNMINQLNAGYDPYAFMIDKISRLEITPAQLALDPCTAGAVVTNVNTGEVLAIVSYPGYDSNRLSNVMDVDYYNQLLSDQSLPLYNNATQARKAPGSTFKPISAVASLEEGVINSTDIIRCTGIYDAIKPSIKCWIYPSAHGAENIETGIQNSCNYFFAELGHRLSTNANGEYSTLTGMEKIRKYATMFGLDHKSGVEITENDPMISDQSPEQSAMGQGTHSFANVQLARYVTAMANRGTVFELSVIDKVTDSQGNLVEDYTPKISSHINIQESTWNTVQNGMRRVIQYGSANKLFRELKVNVAGKTGTAQESKTRGNHAFFISFAPFEAPQVAVTVNIPFGYSSSNAASVAKEIYKLYFGQVTLDDVLKSTAQKSTDVRIGD